MTCTPEHQALWRCIEQRGRDKNMQVRHQNSQGCGPESLPCPHPPPKSPGSPDLLQGKSSIGSAGGRMTWGTTLSEGPIHSDGGELITVLVSRRIGGGRKVGQGVNVYRSGEKPANKETSVARCCRIPGAVRPGWVVMVGIQWFPPPGPQNHCLRVCMCGRRGVCPTGAGPQQED